MKMLVRCPRCSSSREVESENATDRCTHCGYMVTSGPVVAEQVVKIDEPRRRMASMAGGPAQLENATRDLFRLTGGQSIPVEARTPIEPKPKPKAAPAVLSRRPEPPASSPRRTSAPADHSKPAEASILFSLESLMRAATPSEKPDEPDQQLWNMQAETPLFGTSQDHALLTTPLEPPPRSAGMDSMTMSSRRPAGMRMLPLLLAVFGGCGVILVGAAWFVLRPPVAPSPPAQALETPPALEAPGAEPARAAVAALAVRKPATGGLAADPVPTAAKEPPEVKAEPAALAPQSSPAAQAAARTAVPPRATSSAKKPLPRATKTAAAQFDVDAAKNALNTAATKASSCTGTSGKGKVQLTFAPSGKVSAAQLVDGPFAGTPAGKCALKHFRAAHVPAFSGSPQTVAKSFKIP